MAWIFSEKDTKEAPTRSARKQCWHSRDAFFVCLDKLGVDNALDESKQAQISKSCGSEERQFEKDCTKSWIKYFKEQRFYAIKKERVLREHEEQQRRAQQEQK